MKRSRVYYNCYVLSPSVRSNSLWLHGMQPARLLWAWNFLGKNSGVGCLFLLQGTFPTQGSNLRLSLMFPALANGLFTTLPPGKPHMLTDTTKRHDPSQVAFAVLDLGSYLHAANTFTVGQLQPQNVHYWPWHISDSKTIHCINKSYLTAL